MQDRLRAIKDTLNNKGNDFRLVNIKNTRFPGAIKEEEVITESLILTDSSIEIQAVYNSKYMGFNVIGGNGHYFEKLSQRQVYTAVKYIQEADSNQQYNIATMPESIVTMPKSLRYAFYDHGIMMNLAMNDN